MGYPQGRRLGCGQHGLAFRRQLWLQLGPLRLGHHQRSVALVQSRLRYRAWCVLELDVEFHRWPDHACYAAEDYVWDFCFLWTLDVWRWGVRLVLCA